MALMFECDCEDRFVARGDDEDGLMAQVERHVAQAHPALIGKLSRADILARATVVYEPGGPMFASSRVHAALPARDLGRARQFYEGTLGLTPAEERPAGVRYECGGGAALFLFATSQAGRGGHTQAGFEVPDIDAAVAALRTRGVAFKDYEPPALRTVDGVATERDGSRAAWFEDSDGNLLVLVQPA